MWYVLTLWDISFFFFADEEGMDWDSEEPTKSLCSKVEYDCVICNQTTPTTEDKPMGLAVLVQVCKFFLIKYKYFSIASYIIAVWKNDMAMSI